jgi:Raf kinase inhibitor-like YbhB/YbcL family protein
MFRLTSPAFDDGQEMAQKFGKKAQNVSPPLAWEDAPEGTKGFAIALVDRHPVADNYLHWLLDGIDPDRRSLEEGAAGGPEGLAGVRELKPYVGPFPPSGTHDYELTIYALDTQQLDLRGNAGLEEFTRAAEAHSVATATLVGKFTKLG